MRTLHTVLTAALLSLTVGLSACSDNDPTALAESPRVDGPQLALASMVGSATPASIITKLAPSRCLDVSGGKAVSGSPMVIWTCHGGANQTFSWKSNGEIRAFDTMCVGIEGTPTKGSKIAVRPCNGSASQKWTVSSTGQIRGTNGMCADIYRELTADGTPVLLWTCNSGLNQQWDVKSGGGSTSPTPGTVASVAISPSSPSVTVGQSVQLTATMKDASGNTLAGQTASWTSANTAIAKVSSTGSVTGVATGNAVVTATSGGKSASVTVSVTSGQSLSGVAIYPGNDIQAAVNARPAGTRFVIKAGTHRRQSITPKDGNAFLGEPGAILSGEQATTRAFGGSARNVTIQGLIIEKYATPAQQGVIQGDNSDGWLVQQNDIRYNGGTGLRTGNRMRVLNNKLHHNAQMGMGGHGDAVLVENNEIAFNNYQQKYSYTWEAGGTKFAFTTNLIVRGNYVHDNHGPGLWTDIDNIYTTYEGNRVEHNAAAGIFHEISYKAVIRNNTTRNNGYAASWLDGAGILVNCSPNVEIYGNTVSGNRNGIAATESNRGSGKYGPRIVQNLYVHDNVVTMSSGRTGIEMAGSTATTVYSSGRNNRFAHNTYNLSGTGQYFTWMNGSRTDAQWRGYGQDVNGTFNR